MSKFFSPGRDDWAVVTAMAVLTFAMSAGAGAPSETKRDLQDRDQPRSLEIIQQWQATGRVPPKGLEDRNFRDARRVGITSLQSYVHLSEIEPQPGVVDFSYYDPLVAKLKQHKLKWVPFIIVGPCYSTPKWFRESDQSVYARCLEHDQDNVIQSIWNPALPAVAERYLKEMAVHYRDSGVLEAVQLGISGNWGESLYPAWGGFKWREEFHTHKGIWCGDAYARKAFRDSMRRRYRDIDALNSKWGTDYESFESVSPKLAWQGPNKARHDLVQWYIDSMTRYAEMWIACARRHFPDHKIYLCTGGSGDPLLGADFAQQAKMCARYGAGLRITNQSDDYRQSYAGCRWLSTACRHYGTYLATEPAGANTVKGVPMRIFDGINLGADGIYFKNLLDSEQQSTFSATALGELFMAHSDVLRPATPRIEVAAYYPQEWFILHREDLQRYHQLCSRLRDLVDLDMVDEGLIADGVLERYRALVVLPTPEPTPGVRRAIEAWQKADQSRIVVHAVAEKLIDSVAEPLRNRVWGDWREDGAFHCRTDTGMFALNSTTETVVDTIGGQTARIEPFAMVKLSVEPDKE